MYILDQQSRTDVIYCWSRKLQQTFALTWKCTRHA